MFVLKKSDNYSWPVKVRFPVSGGQVKEEIFDAEFQRVSQSELKGLVDKIQNDEIDDVGFASIVLVGWKGVHNEDKSELPFSIENRSQLLDVPGVASAVVGAYLESIRGAKRKN